MGLGLNHVIVQRFTEGFACVEAEAFVPYLKQLFPTLQSLHVGENFRFGAGRRGDGPFLRDSAAEAGVRVFVHAPLCMDGGCVSSSRIREAIQAGRMEEAALLLGRAYRVRGTVVPGRQIGRQIGVPTLNVPWVWEMCPPLGVYAVGCRLHGEQAWIPAIANLGVRPSFGGDASPVLEVHLLSPHRGTLPQAGNVIEVRFGRFVRPEKPFPDADALSRQIQRDRAEVARLHGLAAFESTFPEEA